MATGPADADESGPSSDEDAELIARYRAGDGRAFDEIVRRHSAQIQRLVGRYVRNEADAKDVAQEAFTRAFQGLDSFRGESMFRTWLYRIAVNVALDHIRGNPKRQLEPIEDVTTFTHSLQTSRLVAAELWQKVAKRLD